ncbi:lanthionine synthetase LanC family protein [Sporosarcina limicola]|uniref:tRNA A-37 threonylcarbamoyl transferase component Bud32 n=1 Tax=Sporosarcina limicola TaxID=34101 RepID=A0A927MJ81_9BACL|nr:lanthionine synthetase LanC family protein [Sporosarcina limicola]MBE1555608.1 tRNA A-37 threonylcarbamoyl transferase component Bud32 [Sporosarcina limicola]
MLPVKYSNHAVAFKNNTSFYMINNNFKHNEDSFINLVDFDKNKVEIYIKNPWTIFIFNKNISDKRTADWKIHISSTIDNHEEVLKIAANYCIKNEINFKFTADLDKFREINGKATNRASHGKFIVLYPPEDSILTVLEDLHYKTKVFEGPYILSDKPYKDSKILFYRYGEFIPIRRVSERGTTETFIKNNENKLVQDMRVPYYRIPEWVEDLNVPIKTEKESLFLSKYKPKEALQFSSSGGIYLVEDQVEKQWIAIEARQYSALDYAGFYAPERLEREKDFLIQLEKTGITPKVSDFILEHGNGYLVEEKIEGKSLRVYTYTKNPLISLERDVSKIKKYYENILDIFNQLIEKIGIIHEHGIAIYDISDANVILEEKEDGSFNVRIIDLEHSMFLDETEELRVDTIGYRSKEKNLVKKDLDKIMLIGMVMIYPINNLYELDETKKIALLEWAQENAPFLLDEYVDILLNHFKTQGLISHRTKSSTKYKGTDLIELTSSILGLFDFSSKEKGYYIPADPHIFNTNPFSISHGIYGILFGIYQTYRNLDEPTPVLLEEISLEVFEREFSSIKNLPRNLLIGSSGIVVYLLKIDLIDEARILYKEVAAHPAPLLNDLFYGKAGLVIMHLYYWMKTKDTKSKEQAKALSDQMIEGDELEYSGLYEGKAGVSLALLLTYVVTGERKYLEESEKILKEVLDMLYTNKIGNLTINRKKKGSGESVESAFLFNGLSGVGMLLISFYRITRNPEHKNYLDKIAKSLEHKIQYFPGLMRGLAGVADFLISYYQLVEEDPEVYESIEGKISTFRLFEVFSEHEGKSLGFPGEQSLKIAHDFYTGSMGIVSVISRWISFINNEKITTSTDIVLSIAEEIIDHQRNKFRNH